MNCLLIMNYYPIIVIKLFALFSSIFTQLTRFLRDRWSQRSCHASTLSLAMTCMWKCTQMFHEQDAFAWQICIRHQTPHSLPKIEILHIFEDNLIVDLSHPMKTYTLKSVFYASSLLPFQSIRAFAPQYAYAISWNWFQNLVILISHSEPAPSVSQIADFVKSYLLARKIWTEEAVSQILD